jgi:hypothetical protein
MINGTWEIWGGRWFFVMRGPKIYRRIRMNPAPWSREAQTGSP